MKKNNKPKVGPRMWQAVQFVKQNPGCGINPVAKAIAVHGTGVQFGYRAVHRAIKAGLISARRLPNGRYMLTSKS